MNTTDPSSLKDILDNKPSQAKAPAYPWQDLALRVIKELKIPNFKRNAIFKVCRDYPKEAVERALTDTKELAQGGEAWRYFFKVIASSATDNISKLGQD